MSRRNAAEKIGFLFSKIRAKHNMSQAELAKAMDVSKQTVANWENGITSLSIADAYEIFRILGENPIPYIKELSYEAANSNIEESEKQMAHHNIDCMTDLELRGFNYLMSGLHGSSPYATWQEIIANLSCPIGDKHTVAMIVAKNYKTEMMLGRVQQYVIPDLDALDQAMDAGLDAYVNGRPGYHKL